MGKHFNTKQMKEGLTPITYQYAKDSKVQTKILHIQHTLFTFAKACTHVQNMGNSNHIENSTRLFKECIVLVVKNVLNQKRLLKISLPENNKKIS